MRILEYAHSPQAFGDPDRVLAEVSPEEKQRLQIGQTCSDQFGYDYTPVNVSLFDDTDRVWLRRTRQGERFTFK